MPYAAQAVPEPTREELDRLPGATVVEFGAARCPHCQAVQEVLREVLGPLRDVRHLKIEDGRGRPLGRSFRVKLWPTLVLMRDGTVVEQLVRPTEAEIRQRLAQFA